MSCHQHHRHHRVPRPCHHWLTPPSHPYSHLLEKCSTSRMRTCVTVPCPLWMSHHFHHHPHLGSVKGMVKGSVDWHNGLMRIGINLSSLRDWQIEWSNCCPDDDIERLLEMIFASDMTYEFVLYGWLYFVFELVTPHFLAVKHFYLLSDNIFGLTWWDHLSKILFAPWYWLPDN